MSQILNHYGSDWQSYEWHLIKKKKKNAQISSEPATNASSINDHPKPRQQIRSRVVTQTLETVKRHDQSTWKDPVCLLIDVLYTQTLAKDQIEDTREHALHETAMFTGFTQFSVYPFDHDPL